jgi:K+-sensing histidine kinase KdpD
MHTLRGLAHSEKLLHFATIESDRIDLMLETQTLEPLVETVVRGMAPYCKAQHAKIIVDKTISRLPAVHIDAERISDVIRNVIENAIKFNPHLERTATLSGQRS